MDRVGKDIIVSSQWRLLKKIFQTKNKADHRKLLKAHSDYTPNLIQKNENINDAIANRWINLTDSSWIPLVGIRCPYQKKSQVVKWHDLAGQLTSDLQEIVRYGNFSATEVILSSALSHVTSPHLNCRLPRSIFFNWCQNNSCIMFRYLSPLTPPNQKPYHTFHKSHDSFPTPNTIFYLLT